jgi:hypothetical protein
MFIVNGTKQKIAGRHDGTQPTEANMSGTKMLNESMIEKRRESSALKESVRRWEMSSAG